MHLFLNHARRFRVSTLAVLATTAVCWCCVLVVMHSQTDSIDKFIKRSFHPMMLLLYGVPVLLSGLWTVAVLEHRGYSQTRALRWAIPLSCLLGTTFALMIFGCFYLWAMLWK